MSHRGLTTHTRNVLIVGKTGSGKFIVASKLTGDQSGVSLASISSQVRARTTLLKDENNVYRVQVIETLGVVDAGVTELVTTKSLM